MYVAHTGNTFFNKSYIFLISFLFTNGLSDWAATIPPFFKEFLFFRIVLLPLLWRLAVEKGGFYLLGTAYQDLFGTTILFAAPGAGKTRYALAKLQAPNHFLIGDGSLLYLPDKGIVPVVDELELRFRTISGSIWMKELAMTGKIRLFLYHMISILTRKYVSFNLTLPPEELKIKVRHDSPETIHRFALVHSFDHIQELLFRDVEPTVIEYLRQYHNHYWNIFNDTPPLDATRKNILKFCTRYL